LQAVRIHRLREGHYPIAKSVCVDRAGLALPDPATGATAFAIAFWLFLQARLCLLCLCAWLRLHWVFADCVCLTLAQEDSTGQPRILMQKGKEGEEARNFVVSLDAKTRRVAFAIGGETLLSKKEVPLNGWCHVTIFFDGKRAGLLLDGTIEVEKKVLFSVNTIRVPVREPVSVLASMCVYTYMHLYLLRSLCRPFFSYT
jgi:hypothetical protein